MFKTQSRRVPLAVAVAVLCAGIASWALSAAPAGASATFSPSLKPAVQAQTTLGAPKVAPYTLKKAAQKRLTKPAKPKKAKARSSRRGSSGSELSRARKLLRAQIRKHPILKGTTVSFGNAHGYQAVAYYSSGRIVISRNHRASLSRIISHEVWHVIDWRDNHKIDWGENVPR